MSETANGNGKPRIFDARLWVQILTLVIGLAVSVAVTYATVTSSIATLGVKIDFLNWRVNTLDNKVEKLDERLDSMPHSRPDRN